MTGGFATGTECVHTHERTIDSESYTANQKAAPRAGNRLLENDDGAHEGTS